MKISIIIAFYNNIEWLEMVLAALARQTFTDFEAVIADDGSRPEVVSGIKAQCMSYPFPVKYVWHEDLGWRKNVILNEAVTESEGEYLIFLDGDCIPHHKFVEEHHFCKKRGSVIAGKRVQLTEGLSRTISVNEVKGKSFEMKIGKALLWAGLLRRERHLENAVRITNKWLRKWLIKEKYKNILGCNFSLYKDDLRLVNGFDERFVNPGVGEDTDIEARLRRVGVCPIVKKHLVTVYHRKHVQQDLCCEANQQLYKENNDNNIGWTLYGIQKGDKAV